MFKKLFILALCLMFVTPALALEGFQKEKVTLGVELSVEDKDIDNVELGVVSLGPIGAGLTSTIKDLTISSALVKLGYDLNESAKPYVLVGAARIDMKQQLNGSISLGKYGIGGTVMETDTSEATDLAYGVGIEGGLLEYEGVVLSYDARYWLAGIEDSGKNLTLLPGLYGGLPLNNTVDIDYTELDLSLILSKTFEYEDKIVENLTPYIGYRYSYATVNVENNTSYGPISAESETNYRSHSHDALIGVASDINEDVTVKVAAIVGDDLGGMVSVGYKF